MNEPPVPSAWSEVDIKPGERCTTSLEITQYYSGTRVNLPLFVWRGVKSGPTLCVTAAVHGDEINGTGAIRQIIREHPFDLRAGTLVLVPVVNVLGFEQHMRYLPDRRDLNRCFPGSYEGSLASRFARSFFDQVIRHCDFAIDLHTAAIRRTNFPNIRADMTNEDLAPFARAFGAELIVSGRGPVGSIRRASCDAGCPMLTFEAGEIWKVERGVVEYAMNGIRNCLAFLKMVKGEPVEPPYRIEVDATKWIRARHAGFLEFHVAPGDIVAEGDQLATNTSLLGDKNNIILAPRSAIVLGMTTLPAVAPGSPICHLAYPRLGTLRKAERIVSELSEASRHQRMREDLSRSMMVTEGEESPE